MSGISPINGGVSPIEFPRIEGTPGISGTPETGKAGSSFGDSLAGAIDQLQQTESKSDDLAMKVATGELTDIHDYMIAANQAQIATQMTVAVRNKAVESFQQIMNMQM